MGSYSPAQRSSGPALVSVDTAAAERLHLTVHRVLLAARMSPDWWGTPLETALATVALTRHPQDHWIDAERALSRLLRWWSEEHPRRTSMDTAALALTARAGAELQRRNDRLLSAAVEAVVNMAQRSHPSAPELHVALSVWALDPLIPDRDLPPWPTIRSRMERFNQVGINEPLSEYVAHAARQRFDDAGLLRELLNKIGLAPSVSDSCVLLWLMTVAIEKITLTLPSSDSGLQVLLQRRSDMVQRLAVEVSDQTFFDPRLLDPNDDAEAPTESSMSLSSFEATLLDFALASKEVNRPWVTFEEATNLFDAEAVQARDQLRSERRRLYRNIGVLTGALGISCGVIFWFALRRIGLERSVSTPGAAAFSAMILAIAVSLTSRGRGDAPLVEPIGGFFIAASLSATIVAVNQLSRKPIVSDLGGLVVVTLISAAIAVVWKVINLRRR
jgi:hypothetical protein